MKVGLVGKPNAGKSSLLSLITRARPKVGGYPFTTLSPALGVMERNYKQFTVADMPGLIERASEGKGLGIGFLKHISRARVLIHLIDGGAESPVSDMKAVNAELYSYSGGKDDRPQVIAINKIDLPHVREEMEDIRGALSAEGCSPEFVSAETGEGVEELMSRVIGLIEMNKTMDSKEKEPDGDSAPSPGLHYEITHSGGTFTVKGEGVVEFAGMMPLDLEEGRRVFWERLKAQGIVAALKREGARAGSVIVFGDTRIEWLE